MDIKATKKEIIEWIQVLDDKKLLSELYYYKQHHKKVTPAEKKDLNQWLSELEYVPQLEALRSIIASAPDPDAIKNELSPEAQENIRTEEEVEKTDLQHTPETFWDLVWSFRESEKFTWDDLSEADKESIERGIADAEAGRTTPHEEVRKKWEQWLNDIKFKEVLDKIVDLPVEMRAQLADEILQTLNPIDPDIQDAWVEEVHRRMKAVKEGKSKLIPGEQVERDLREKLEQRKKQK